MKGHYEDGDWEIHARSSTLENSFAIQVWLDDVVLKEEIRFPGGFLCAEDVQQLSVVPVDGRSQYVVTVIVGYRFYADSPSEDEGIENEEAIPVKVELGTTVSFSR